MKQFTVNEIGVIYNDYINPKIVVHEQYLDCLQGVNGFSHLMILWWADKLDQPEIRSVYKFDKPYVYGPKTIGVFGTRSPVRPNLIATSTIQVKEIDYEQGIIYTDYIDADDQTPLLDIKPYTPSADRIIAPKVPDWCEHWPKSYEESGSFDWEKEFND